MFSFLGGWATLALAGGIAAGIGFLILYARRQGAKAEKAKQQRAREKARTISDDIDDAVAGRSAEANKARLRRWQSKS